MKHHYLSAMYRSVLMLSALLTASAFLPDGRSAGQTASTSPREHQEYEGTELTIRIYFKPLPKKMPGSEGDTRELIELGRRLFFERDLSLTKTQSCNDCHRLDSQQAGDDHQPTSKGALGIAGKRNSPTVLNAGFQVAQFWDGRSSNLEEQLKGPLLNPVEMAMRAEGDVMQRLKSTPDYRFDFERAFPDQADPFTFDNVARAIAAFERTLVAPSRFDRYLRGETEALTTAEQTGLQRFVNTGCVDCHGSHPVGGRLLQKLGIYHPYGNQSDTGRREITGNEEDRFVFKVCMLRNVTLTPPYFHDGQVSTLSQAVRLMAWMQLDTLLSQAEVDEILGFLRTLEAEDLAHGKQPGYLR
jgi:cytochrome c peroxidase